MLLDASHTSHTRAQTGIQRVVRSLAAELAQTGELHPICFDPHLQGWRRLDAAERAALADRTGHATSRGARWSLRHRVLGRAKRLFGQRHPAPAGEALLCPELFSARAATHFPELFAAVRGPRVAVFHDAIGLKFPEHTPPATVSRLPAYLRELAQFDGVAAVSADSAASLQEFWAWAELRATPPVVTIPLGVDPLPSPTPPPPAGVPRVLSVGTLEGRKNHRALLDAAELLWRDGVKFELELVGLPRADTGAAALERLRALQAAARPVVHHSSVADAGLHEAYARSTFTVYPSLYEGFGLPVLESLQHGRPCLCGAGGALAETARGGGAVLLGTSPSASEIAQAMRSWLENPASLAPHSDAARTRRFRTWSDYAADFRTWLRDLPRRS
jgi:glycosyltransferase involved in cell wall biosynthesis